jgi:hypothetical protein
MKVRVPWPDWGDPAPCVGAYHIDDPYLSLGPWPIWHAVCLWDTRDFKPMDVLWPVQWEPGDPFTFGDVTEAQLALAGYAISNPAIIAIACPYCVFRYGVPSFPQWRASPGHTRLTVPPACAYDDTTFPPIWNPDLWPPDYPT